MQCDARVCFKSSDKLITPWGGIALIKRMLDQLGFDQAWVAAGMP